MGGRGNSGNRNTAAKFTVSADSYGITDRTVKELEDFVNDAIKYKFDEDSAAFIENIKPKDRERLAQSMADSFKKNLGWGIDVRIGRKTESGGTSRLRGGGKVGKMSYTVISYRKRG